MDLTLAWAISLVIPKALARPAWLIGLPWPNPLLTSLFGCPWYQNLVFPALNYYCPFKPSPALDLTFTVLNCTWPVPPQLHPFYFSPLTFKDLELALDIEPNIALPFPLRYLYIDLSNHTLDFYPPLYTPELDLDRARPSFNLFFPHPIPRYQNLPLWH